MNATIDKRIAALEACAKASVSPNVTRFMGETADMLRALSAQYKALSDCCADTIQRSNGSDPAINILITELEEKHGRKVRPVEFLGGL